MGSANYEDEIMELLIQLGIPIRKWNTSYYYDSKPMKPNMEYCIEERSNFTYLDELIYL